MRNNLKNKCLYEYVFEFYIESLERALVPSFAESLCFIVEFDIVTVFNSQEKQTTGQLNRYDSHVSIRK